MNIRIASKPMLLDGGVGKEHSPYLPASTRESAEYQRFVNRALLVWVSSQALTTYALSFYLEEEPTFDLIGSLTSFDPIRTKYEGLRALDGVSHHAYAAVLIATIVFSPILATVLIQGYRSRVLSRGKAARIGWNSLWGTLGFVVFMLIVGYLVIVHVPVLGPYPPRNVGVHLWPLLPIYACLLTFFISSNVFLVAATIIKLFSGRYWHGRL